MEDLNDKINGNTLQAPEWNQVPSELQNIIEAFGQTLAAGNLNQLGIGVASYVSNGNFYTEAGAADAYVCSVIGSKQAPFAYADGMGVSFVPANSNTGVSTVNVVGLGVKNIFFNGAALVAGMIENGTIVTLAFDVANDRFNLINNQIIERSFTPELWDDNLNGSEAQIYSIQEGKIKQIGNIVFYTARIAMTSLGTLTAGNGAHIGNFPLPARSTPMFEIMSVNVGRATNLSTTVVSGVTGVINPGDSHATLLQWDSTTGTSQLSIFDLTATADIAISGFYYIS